MGTRCVRIWKDSRRFVPTGVFVITGVSECAVNIRRRPDDVAALLVSPRRREANFQLKSTFSEKNVCTCMRRIVAHVRALSEKKHLSSSVFFRARTFLGVRLNFLCKLVLYRICSIELFLLPIENKIRFSGIVIAFRISQLFP